MHIRESIGNYLYRRYHITPDGLSAFRMFSGPWIGLSIAYALMKPSLARVVFVVILYGLVVATDAIDGPLARLLRREQKLEVSVKGAVLDRVSDKFLIACSLIPFGPTASILIILACESVLAYQALFPPKHTLIPATIVGKLKMVFQSLLVPLFLCSAFFNTDWIQTSVLTFAWITALLSLSSLVTHIAPVFVKHDLPS